jgi:phosphatidylglycerol---prolipoprotein diacylglyceryl transferase
VYPFLYEFEGLRLGTWGLMVTLAFIVASVVLGARSGKVGIDPDRLMNFFLLITFGGLVGSRLLHFLMAEPSTFLRHPLDFFNPTKGGFAFYGGAIFSTIAGAVYAVRARIPAWKLADAAAPSIMLGLAIGRLGCFFAGCCHGRPVGVAAESTLLHMSGGSVVTTHGFPYIALVFEKGVGMGDIFDVPLYPTQVWESLAAFLLFLFLSWEWKYARKFDGQVIATLMVTYPILRTVIESFRGDTVRGTSYFGALSTSQVVSIPVLAIGLGIFLFRFRRGIEPEAEIVYDEEGESVGG